MSLDPDARGIVEEFELRMREGHEREARALMHADFRMLEPASLPYGGTFSGPDGFASFRQVFVSIWDQVDRGEWVYFPGDSAVARRADVSATSRFTGKRVSWPHCEIFTVRDGLILQLEVFYFDTAALLPHMG